jgi:hypothetical protein
MRNLENASYLLNFALEPTLINCTPHPVEMRSGSGLLLESYPPSGIVPRVLQRFVPLPKLDGFSVTAREIYHVKDIPEPQPGVMYIVSSLVSMALPNRCDLLVPRPFYNKETGATIGATGFYYDLPIGGKN